MQGGNPSEVTTSDVEDSMNPFLCCFRGHEGLKQKYNNFVAQKTRNSGVLLAFYVFATASTFQYSNVFRDATRGDFGWVIASAFVAWILGFACLTIAMGFHTWQHYSPANKEVCTIWRNRIASLFIILQPIVHGGLILGRTLSPRVCSPDGYKDTTRSILSIMEEQMTCNTTVSGRIPPELTMAMGVFMLAHQYIFDFVGWSVLAMHWLVGFAFLCTAHSTTMTRASFGEDIMIIVCFLGIMLIMYGNERKRKENFQLKLNIDESGYLNRTIDSGGWEKESSAGEVQINTSSSNGIDSHPTANNNRFPFREAPLGIHLPKSHRHEFYDDSSVSSMTMEDNPKSVLYGPSGNDPYDDYGECSLVLGYPVSKRPFRLTHPFSSYTQIAFRCLLKLAPC